MQFNLTGDDLSVGPGGLFGPTLSPSPDKIVNVTNNTTIEADGMLLLHGDFSAGTITNSGLIRGSGTVRAAVANEPTGIIRVAGGEYQQWIGSGHVNSGQINLLTGALEVAGPVVNQPAGTISGRGALVFDDADGLTNHGTMNFGGGTDLYGKVVNGREGGMGTDGEITVSGGASVAFHGDVVHNGVKFKVADHANVVFFGDYSGAGEFTGSGGVFYEGTVAPGNSPATISFGGNVVFGSAASVEIELDGTTPGSEYDQLHVVGEVNLGDATLDVLLGYAPARGDTFTIIDNELADPIIGQFAGLPDDSTFLVDGYPLRIDYQGGDGNDVALMYSAAQITGRHLFYNNSAFGDAVAPDKAPLMPGETADFENYTSCSRGINGVLIDVADLASEPTGDDFDFKVGNDDDPDGWTDAPKPIDIVVRPGEGIDQSDRIAILWDDNQIINQWLQVTMLANDDTGLIEDDVFYFGNAVGESGNLCEDARVNAIDALLARNNPRTVLNPAPIDFPYDFNRDGHVNAFDVLAARSRQTHLLDALSLITVPPKVDSGKLGTQAVPEPSTVVMLIAAAVECLMMRRRNGRRRS